MTDSPAQVKYRRGQNPRSLANLRPWTKEHQPQYPPQRGPLITPRIRSFVQMAPAEFFRIEFKTMADAIAAAYVLEAAMSGFERSRAELTDRVDGPVAKGNGLVGYSDKTFILQVVGVQRKELG